MPNVMATLANIGVALCSTPQSLADAQYLTAAGAQPRFQSWGVQFRGLGYCTEQNTDGIPSFMHCSLLRNGNHTLHRKSWGGPSKFWGSGPPTPSGWALGLRSSNAAKTWKPLKLAGVAQITGPISAAGRPKFTILWGHLEEILLVNKFFFDCWHVP